MRLTELEEEVVERKKSQSTKKSTGLWSLLLHCVKILPKSKK